MENIKYSGILHAKNGTGYYFSPVKFNRDLACEESNVVNEVEITTKDPIKNWPVDIDEITIYKHEDGILKNVWVLKVHALRHGSSPNIHFTYNTVSYKENKSKDIATFNFLYFNNVYKKEVKLSPDNILDNNDTQYIGLIFDLSSIKEIWALLHKLSINRFDFDGNLKETWDFNALEATVANPSKVVVKCKKERYNQVMPTKSHKVTFYQGDISYGPYPVYIGNTYKDRLRVDLLFDKNIYDLDCSAMSKITSVKIDEFENDLLKESRFIEPKHIYSFIDEFDICNIGIIYTDGKKDGKEFISNITNVSLIDKPDPSHVKQLPPVSNVSWRATLIYEDYESTYNNVTVSLIPPEKVYNNETTYRTTLKFDFKIHDKKNISAVGLKKVVLEKQVNNKLTNKWTLSVESHSFSKEYKSATLEFWYKVLEYREGLAAVLSKPESPTYAYKAIFKMQSMADIELPLTAFESDGEDRKELFFDKNTSLSLVTQNLFDINYVEIKENDKVIWGKAPSSIDFIWNGSLGLNSLGIEFEKEKENEMSEQFEDKKLEEIKLEAVKNHIGKLKQYENELSQKLINELKSEITSWSWANGGTFEYNFHTHISKSGTEVLNHNIIIHNAAECITKIFKVIDGDTINFKDGLKFELKKTENRYLIVVDEFRLKDLVTLIKSKGGKFRFNKKNESLKEIFEFVN